MSIPIDSISVKDWIAIDFKPEPEVNDSHFSGQMFKPQVEYSGEPAEVVAISLPFILVRDVDGGAGTIDVRNTGLIKVSRQYVKQYREGTCCDLECQTAEPGKMTPIRRRECPVCQGPLKEKKRPGSSWAFICGECGFHGERNSKK